jgi:hypothetical protein
VLNLHILFYLLEFGLEAADSVTHAASIDLQLGFSRASSADASGQSVQVFPEPFQTREFVLQLGQLDLSLGNVGSCSLREDVKNEFVAIDDPDACGFF